MKKILLFALCLMWNQYCGKKGHLFMSAGEETAEILIKEGLLKDEWSEIDPEVYDKLLTPLS